MSSDPIHKLQTKHLNNCVMDTTHIPLEYLEEVAASLELTVDYLLSEFVIDGSLEIPAGTVTVENLNA